MSCHIMENSVIDGLLTYLNKVANERGSPFCQGDLDQMGMALVFQNARSWNSRYPRDRINQFDAYTFRLHPEAPSGTWTIVKACDYASHQCDETTDWKTTPAFRVISRIRRMAMMKGGFDPDNYDFDYLQLPEYTAAAWGMVHNPHRMGAAA